MSTDKHPKISDRDDKILQDMYRTRIPSMDQVRQIKARQDG